MCKGLIIKKKKENPYTQARCYTSFFGRVWLLSRIYFLYKPDANIFEKSACVYIQNCMCVFINVWVLHVKQRFTKKFGSVIYTNNR
jgi:hypothetical protein